MLEESNQDCSPVKSSWDEIGGNTFKKIIFSLHHEFFDSVYLPVSWTAVMMQEQSLYIGEIENLMQRTQTVFKKPGVITIPQVLFNWLYSRIWWLLFFQIFFKDAYSFQTPIPWFTLYSMTEPFQNVAEIASRFSHILEGLFSHCAISEWRDTVKTLDLVYLKFTFYLDFLWAYYSCICLPIPF